MGGGGRVAKDRVGVGEVGVAVADGGYAAGFVVGGGVGLAGVLGDVGVGKVIMPGFTGWAG